MQSYAFNFPLPKDVLITILSFLDCNDLCSARTSCTAIWHCSKNEKDIWKRSYCNSFKSTVFDKMPDYTNWEQVFKDRVKQPQIDLEVIGQQLIRISKMNFSSEIRKMIMDVTKNLAESSDVIRFADKLKDPKYPRWLVTGTFFEPKSFHSFAYGNQVRTWNRTRIHRVTNWKLEILQQMLTLNADCIKL